MLKRKQFTQNYCMYTLYYAKCNIKCCNWWNSQLIIMQEKRRRWPDYIACLVVLTLTDLICLASFIRSSRPSDKSAFSEEYKQIVNHCWIFLSSELRSLITIHVNAEKFKVSHNSYLSESSHSIAVKLARTKRAFIT